MRHRDTAADVNLDSQVLQRVCDHRVAMIVEAGGRTAAVAP
jgi:hypothetical protein